MARCLRGWSISGITWMQKMDQSTPAPPLVDLVHA
jgi:hypothetical protein